MTGTSTLSTHVLDAALGAPAAGLEVILDAAPDSGASSTAPDSGASSSAVPAATDADGRVRFDGTVAAGPHTLTFSTGPWFAAQDRDTFFPSVQIAFEVDPAQEHYHVALLLSPYAYTTYRGS